MKVIGVTTRLTEKVDSFMPTVTFTLDTGKTIKRMAEVSTAILMALVTQESGKKISSMGRE